MGTQYTITVKNIGKDSKPFMLFVDQPKFEGQTTAGIWSNVFMSSESITGPNGITRFVFSKAFYAVCGSTKVPLSGDGMVETGDFIDIELKQKNPGSVVLLQADAANRQAPHVKAMDDAEVAKIIPMGGFAYLTGSDIVQLDPRNIFIGLGAKNADGVAPIASITPGPEMQYMITPKNKYYINSGSKFPGKIMDYTSSIRTAALVDFTGRTETNAIVTVDEHNKWAVSYSV